MSSPIRGRKRGGLRAAAMSVISSLVLPASTLLMAPVILSRLGAKEAAGVFVALAASRVVASADLGIVGLAIPRAAEIADDPDRTWRFLMRSIARLAGIAAVLAAVALAAVAAGVRLPGTGDAADSALLLGGAAVVSLTFQAMMLANSVLYATRRFAVLAWASAIGAVVYIAAILLGLEQGRAWMVIAAVVAQNLAVFLLGVAAVVLGAGRGPRAEGRLSTLDDDGVGAEGRLVSGPMQFIGAGSVVTGQAPTIIAAFVLDPVAVAAVGVAQQVGTLVRLGGVSLAGYFLATLSHIRDRAERRQRALWLHRRWVAACWAGGLAVAAVAPVAVDLWLGTSMPAGAGSAGAFAALAGAGVVSTLVVTSYQRTISELVPEVLFVTALVLGLVPMTVVGAVAGTASTLWATAADHAQVNLPRVAH